jgi:hypothetical protein
MTEIVLKVKFFGNKSGEKYISQSRMILTTSLSKGVFFQEMRFVFQISQKKLFKKTILNLKFKIPAHNSIMLWAGILNFKFVIVFRNTFLWRCEKRIVLSEKSHL